ncbi:ADP-ribose diphosphatase [Hahella sp. CCB-MM4]|uniref:NUDIX domain-containing protein n=1 Tax=Hahella sp. (strain CCB-MM4) TaxID=1926491 RepID=UPI000B9A9EFA|nr:NUDIX domain-containing protein [Hahella sp. CCB-MM4]OZG71415.1 ADP-ribose diphosphatase [Hahella sp. CCB-MM4]
MSVEDAAFSKQNVKILETKDSYRGFFKIKSLKLQHAQFAGGWGPELQRELFVRGSATVMLPYDPWRDMVVLCEQFRIGAIEDAQSPWLLELVAGMDDPGESPEQVAIREAQEEAGLEVLALKQICQYYPSPGGSSEFIHLYCGLVHSDSAGGLHGLDEEGEDIRVHVLPRSDAFALVTRGRINNAASIIGLQWLEMNYQFLQEEWRTQG